MLAVMRPLMCSVVFKVEREYGCGGYNTLAAAGPLLVGGLALTIAGAISTRRLRQRGAHPPHRNYAARILGVTLFTVGASALTGLALFSDAFCTT